MQSCDLGFGATGMGRVDLEGYNWEDASRGVSGGNVGLGSEGSTATLGRRRARFQVRNSVLLKQVTTDDNLDSHRQS